MSTSNTITPGMWRILGYVLLGQAALSIFQHLSWQQFDYDTLAYDLIYPDSTLCLLVRLAGIGAGIFSSRFTNGFRQALLVGFGLEFMGLLVLFGVGNFQIAWLLSFFLIYAGFSLILLQCWIRYNIYFPWATQAKLLAFMLLGVAIPVGAIVAELLLWASYAFFPWIEDFRSITYIAGLAMTIAGVWMGLKDSLNEFFIPPSEELEGEQPFWRLPLGLLLIGFITWLGYTAIDTTFHSSSYYTGGLLSFVPLLSSLIPFIFGALIYRWYRVADQTAKPLFWLWVGLSIQVLILLFNWFTPNLSFIVNTIVDYLHQYFLLIFIQPILALLIFHRLPFQAHWWFGGLIAMTILSPIVADWLLGYKGLLFIGLLLTFGPLIIGIRENRATLRELFQLDEAAFEVENPSDDPLDSLTDHLIDDER